MEIKQRVFSIEDDFMNFRTDDLLYGFMRSISTTHPTGKKTVNGKDEYEEYLTKKIFSKNKKLIANICGCSTRTVERKLEKLAEAGLVTEDLVRVTVGKETKEVECYIFPLDTEYKLYQKIDKEVLKYLVDTRNAFAIRIYVYLLNRYQYKRDKCNGEKYIFTLGELAKMFGYAESTKTCNEVFRNVLASFNKEGILKCKKVLQSVEYSEDNNGLTHTERYQLDYVIEHETDLPVL